MKNEGSWVYCKKEVSKIDERAQWPPRDLISNGYCARGQEGIRIRDFYVISFELPVLCYTSNVHVLLWYPFLFFFFFSSGISHHCYFYKTRLKKYCYKRDEEKKLKNSFFSAWDLIFFFFFFLIQRDIIIIIIIYTI